MFRRQSSTPRSDLGLAQQGAGHPGTAHQGATDLGPVTGGLDTLEPRGASRWEPEPATGAETPTRRSRHTRRAQARDAADAAARQAQESADATAARARLQRVQQRLADVGSTARSPMPTKPAVIDDDAARRDPMTRPFPMVFGTPRAPRDEHGRRVRTLGTERRPGVPGVVR